MESKYSLVITAVAGALKKVFGEPFKDNKSAGESKEEVIQRLSGSVEEILKAELELIMNPSPEDILLLSMCIKTVAAGMRTSKLNSQLSDNDKAAFSEEITSVEECMQKYLLIKVSNNEEVKTFVSANMPKAKEEKSS